MKAARENSGRHKIASRGKILFIAAQVAPAPHSFQGK